MQNLRANNIRKDNRCFQGTWVTLSNGVKIENISSFSNMEALVLHELLRMESPAFHIADDEFSSVSLLYGISTFLGYLMPKPSL